MMARVLIYFAIALGLSVRAAVFHDANKLYEQGKYAEAIPLYENLLKSGHHSPGVLFNLGNAHFKNGELGRAILLYHRAQRIAPRDPDVRANLHFARERVSGSISVQPGILQEILGRFRLNEISTLTALFLWVWLGLLCVSKWRPPLRAGVKPYATVCAFLFGLGLLVLLAAYDGHRKRIAIVMGQQATVRLGPLEESQPAFTATDGTELRLLARRDEWLQVADRSGRTGWLPAAAAAVFPENAAGSSTPDGSTKGGFSLLFTPKQGDS